jgi:molybdenum cofactor guanylyltransferase
VDYPETLGVVLAGGLARRMGGGDKSHLHVGGKTILDRVIERLRPQCGRLVINTNTDAGRFADTGLAVAADSIADHPGPLAGILAGLDWAARHAPQIEWVVSVPSDCPFLPRDLVARLHRTRLDAKAVLACASSGGRRHPVVALWPPTLRDELRRAITREGTRRVSEWSARYACGIAEWPAEPVDPFFNVNTPGEFAEAERMAARHPEA